MKYDIGKTIGEWTVIAKSDSQIFICRCSCGIEKRVHASNLRKRKHPACRKCGMNRKGLTQRNEKLEELKVKLIGNTFGQRTVISYVGYKNAHHMFLVRCGCGREFEIIGQKLLVGRLTCCLACNALHKIPCQVCGCIGRHKNIDLESSMCDHLGVCSACDDFDVGQIKIPSDMKWYRSKKIRKLAALRLENERKNL